MKNNEDKINQVQEMLFGHLSKKQMEQIASILSETPLPKRKLKAVPKKKKMEAPPFILPEGILDFYMMKVNKNRTLAERQDPKWRQSCEFWCQKFQEFEQPLEIHWSVMEEPRATTAYIRDVKAERAEITKIGGGNADEKTIMYFKVWGLNIPADHFRKQGKKKMHEMWKVSLEDKPEFLKFREFLVQQALAGVSQPVIEDASKEEIGARFERQLEWQFNMEGYHVDLHGRKKKTEDDGVDLILVKNGKTTLVQAKAISKSRKLTPADVDIMASELRGFYLKNIGKNDAIVGELSRVMLVVANGESLPEETRKHAETIGLSCKISAYKDVWPEIKCAITTGGRKIYYTPEDAHYNTTKMLADKKRFWAETKEEAEKLGYQSVRAFSNKIKK